MWHGSIGSYQSLIPDSSASVPLILQGMSQMSQHIYRHIQTCLQDAKDIVIVPRRTYRDPFRGGDNVLVLADTYEDQLLVVVEFLCHWVSKWQMLLAKRGMTLPKYVLHGFKYLQGPSNCISIDADRVLCAGALWWWARPWQGHQVQCTCCLPSSTSVATPGLHHIGCPAAKHSAPLLDCPARVTRQMKLIAVVYSGHAASWRNRRGKHLKKMSCLTSDTWRVLRCFPRAATCVSATSMMESVLPKSLVHTGYFKTQRRPFVRVFVLTLFGTLSFSVLCPSLSFQDPWFGFEQEYYLIDPKTKWPLGWPAGRYPDKDTDAWHNNCITWQNLAKRPTWYRLGQGVEFAWICQPSNLQVYVMLEQIQYLRYIMLHISTTFW